MTVQVVEVIQELVQVVEVAHAVGPVGPAGPSGSSIAFEYTQASPLATWTISVPGSFGRRPNVAVYVSGDQVIADVNVSPSQIVITFASPVAGLAVIS